jgi:hypothetical protein
VSAERLETVNRIIAAFAGRVVGLKDFGEAAAALEAAGRTG